MLYSCTDVYFCYLSFTAGEEVINPKRNIPLSILLTLIISSILYISLSLELTLMVPYYAVDLAVPYSQAFAAVHISWASVVVSVGETATLVTW
jgi:amino acid transporter